MGDFENDRMLELVRAKFGIWADGLPPDEIGIYGRKIAATTTADVDAAAHKYFPAGRTAIVAVREEKVIREALAPFGIPIETLR